jgi:hypothetical protein
LDDPNCPLLVGKPLKQPLWGFDSFPT